MIRVEKAVDLVYSQRRVRALLAGAEEEISKAFLESIQLIRSENTLRELIRLLEQGQVDEALAVAERAIAKAAQVTGVQFLRAGQDAAAFIGAGLPAVVVFDTINDRAVAAMKAASLRMIREFTDDQRTALRDVMVNSVTRGLNPREQAREFRASVGLTQRQVAAVENYRRLLGLGTQEALTRRLRDRRFDPTVTNAALAGKPLTPTQIDRMVDRYRERYIKYRAEVIARTEALRAVHEGTEEGFRQAIEQGVLDPDSIEKEWHTASDDRVRDPAHTLMNGQKRREGEAFESGLGNALRYPGDIEAPAEEVIQCRCAVSRRIKRLRRA